MANSIGGVKVFMKAVVDTKPWLKDPPRCSEKWDEDEYNLVDHGSGKNLCLGSYGMMRHVVPHPPIRRALEMTKTALEKPVTKVCLPNFSVEFCSSSDSRDWKPIKHGSITEATVATSVFNYVSCLPSAP